MFAHVASDVELLPLGGFSTPSAQVRGLPSFLPLPSPPPPGSCCSCCSCDTSLPFFLSLPRPPAFPELLLLRAAVTLL